MVNRRGGEADEPCEAGKGREASAAGEYNRTAKLPERINEEERT